MASIYNQMDPRKPQANLLADMDDVCPICKGDRYLNPNMIILVGPCFHIMCDKCVARLFGLDPAPCPECKSILRKVDFTSQTFEDLEVEKEVRIRKKLARDFNLRQDEFKTIREYDEYLEQLEDITFNLINGIDLEETNARIEEHRKKHEKAIKWNIERKAKEDRAFTLQEEEKIKVKKEAKSTMLQELDNEKKRKREQKEFLLQQLKKSDQSAQEILRKNQKVEDKSKSTLRSQFRGSSSQSGSMSYLQLRQLEEEQLEEEIDFNPSAPFFKSPPTHSQIMNTYYDPVWQTDKNAEKMASAGGYVLRHFHLKAIASIHDGALVPLPSSSD